MKSLVILGAGGHGKVVADVAAASGKYSTIIFLDDAFPELHEVSGWPVTGKLDTIGEQARGCTAIVALGNNNLRLKWLEKLNSLNVDIATIYHPKAIVAERVNIDVGTVLMAGSIVNIDTSIGKACIINTGSIIEHDNHLADGVHVSPGVQLGGGVVVGECTWIGLGASVIQNINIGEECIIGAGSVVLSAVENGETVAGCPAKKLK